MTVVKRFTRIFKADLHGVLDCIEEPEAIVKQAIRDMEAIIARKQEKLETAQAETKRIQRKVEDQLRKQSEAEEKIQVAFSASDDELAKSFIKRKLAGEKLLLSLSEGAQKNKEAAEQLEKEITEKQTELAAVEEKLKIFSESTSSETSGSDNTVIDEEVEVEFIKLKREYEQTTAEEAA